MQTYIYTKKKKRNQRWSLPERDEAEPTGRRMRNTEEQGTEKQ